MLLVSEQDLKNKTDFLDTYYEGLHTFTFKDEEETLLTTLNCSTL